MSPGEPSLRSPEDPRGVLAEREEYRVGDVRLAAAVGTRHDVEPLFEGYCQGLGAERLETLHFQPSNITHSAGSSDSLHDIMRYKRIKAQARSGQC